jgi:glycerophosphoryl diester phosphodiesterase
LFVGLIATYWAASPVHLLAQDGAIVSLNAEAPTAASVSAAASIIAADLIIEPRVLVIAHRGASADAPENTLPAFEQALDANSDLVELDYVHTSDGVPLVIHDGTLDRTTDAEVVFGGRDISVSSKPLAELLKLDAGSWFDRRFAGTRLPTLDESLDLIQRGSVTLIERKAGEAKTCVELLERKSLVPHVVVQSFDWEFLADCHRRTPQLVLGALGGKEITPERLAAIERTGAKVVGWHEKYLDRAAVDALHNAGYRVWAYTVDDRRRAQALVELGIDGIITNVPGKVRALVDNPR